MNPDTVTAAEPVVEHAAQINPWLPSAPTDTSWLDAAGATATPEHASGFHLTQLFDGSLPLEAWINQGLGWVVANFRPFFQAVRAPIDATLTGVSDVLLAAPSLAGPALVACVAHRGGPLRPLIEGFPLHDGLDPAAALLDGLGGRDGLADPAGGAHVG